VLKRGYLPSGSRISWRGKSEDIAPFTSPVPSEAPLGIWYIYGCRDGMQTPNLTRVSTELGVLSYQI